MTQWIQRSGFDWQLIESSEPSGPTRAVTLGATLAYGLLDESVADFGTLRTLMGRVRAELARPVELAGGQVSVPEAMVEINPDVVTLAVRGEPEVVTSAWRRLSSLFSDPLAPETATPAAVDEFGWPRDAALRCGMNAFTLTMITLNVPENMPSERLDRLRTHLDPAQSQVRWAFFTTDASMIELSAFQAPRSSDEARRAAGRGQGFAMPANIRSIPGPIAFTVVTPRTWAGLAAAMVVRAHFARCLYAVNNASPAVGFSVHALGSDQWIHIVCPEMPEPGDRGRAVSLTLTSPVPDAVIDGAIDDVSGRDPSVHDRERRVLGLGEDQFPSPADVRAAVVAALQTVHVPAENVAQEIGGFPELMGPLPPESGKQFHSWLVNRDISSTGAPASVTLGPRVLSQPIRGNSDEVDTVDLHEAALVIERPDGLLSVMDTKLRIVDVRPDAFRNGKLLRQLLDQRLIGVPRLAGRPHPDVTFTDEVSSATRSGRQKTILAFSILALGLAFIVIMILVQTLR